MSKWSSLSLFIGRLCLSTIFILSGINKFVQYDANVQYMAAKGMTMIPLFLVIAALIEILCGLSILLGFKSRWGAAILILYLIPVTVIFHNFWSVEGTAHQMQLIEFLKNLAIWGGLFCVLGTGPGRFSLSSHYRTKSNFES